MNTNLTAAQESADNTEAFRKAFGTLDHASIGVIMSRTREPFRAANALREYAVAHAREFRLWTMSNGWALFDNENPNAEPTYDSAIEPPVAVRKIADTQAGFSEEGIFVMVNIHKALTQSALITQFVKDYSRTFSSNGMRRLVLLVPPSYQLPEELEDDVVMLDFEPPSYAELRDSYEDLLDIVRESTDSKGNPVEPPAFNAAEVDRILAAGAGMTSQEFTNAISRALVTYGKSLSTVTADEFVKVVTDAKTEVVRRSGILEIMEPGSMSDIGGLAVLKSWVAKRAHCFGQEAKEFGIEPPKGIALIGPPGTGKSLGAKAVASVLGIPALKFDVGKVFNSLVGQSEQRVRETLKLVDAMSPCVLMIDEADKAFAGQAGGGSGGDSGVGMRVLGAILTWMQETTSPVFVVVTANRVQNLPTEFLRRGRLDEIFSVTTPNEEERLEILRIHLRKRGRNPDEVEGLEAVAANCAGYVPAELESAVKDALIEAFTQKVELTGELIDEQLSYLKPLSEAFAEDFRQMEEWAENNARAASLPIGATTEMRRTRTPRANAAAPTGTRSRKRTISLDG